MMSDIYKGTNTVERHIEAVKKLLVFVQTHVFSDDLPPKKYGNPMETMSDLFGDWLDDITKFGFCFIWKLARENGNDFLFRIDPKSVLSSMEGSPPTDRTWLVGGFAFDSDELLRIDGN